MSSWKGQAEQEKIELREAQQRRENEEYARQQAEQERRYQEQERYRQDSYRRQSEEHQSSFRMPLYLHSEPEQRRQEQEKYLLEKISKELEENHLKDVTNRFLEYIKAHQKNQLTTLIRSGGIQESQFFSDLKWVDNNKLTLALLQKKDSSLFGPPQEIEQFLKIVTEIIRWYFHLKNNGAKELVLKSEIAQIINYVNQFLKLPECDISRNFKTLTFEDGYRITLDQLVELMRHVETIRINCSSISDELVQLISEAKQKAGIDSNLKNIVLKPEIQASTAQVKRLFGLVAPAVAGINVHRKKMGESYSWLGATRGTDAIGYRFKFSGTSPITSEDVNELLSLSSADVKINFLSLSIDGVFSSELSLSEPEKITELAIVTQKFYPSMADEKFAKFLASLPQLQRLRFSGISFQTPETKQSFLAAIAKKTNISELTLDECQLNDNDIQKFIIPYLNSNNNVISLSLRNNQFTADGIQQLTNYIRDANLNIVSVDILPQQSKLLSELLHRNGEKKSLEEKAKVVCNIVEGYKNLNEVFVVASKAAQDLHNQNMNGYKALFFARLRAIDMQPNAKSKLSCHRHAIEILVQLISAGLSTDELANLYSQYQAQFLPKVIELAESTECILSIESLFVSISKIVTKIYSVSDAANCRSRLFLMWLDIIDKQADYSTRLLCHRAAIECLSRSELSRDELTRLYEIYERRSLPGISNIAMSDSVLGLFTAIGKFLTTKREGKFIAKEAHFVSLASACMSERIIKPLCEAVQTCQFDGNNNPLREDLIKIYIAQIKPSIEMLEEILSLFRISSDQIKDLYTLWIYELLQRKVEDAEHALENCNIALRIARSKKLDELCLLDCYVAYAEAFKKILDSKDADVKFLDFRMWQELYTILLNSQVRHSINRLVPISKALLTFCQSYLERNLPCTLELENKFIHFLKYCTTCLPAESINTEACLVKIYRDRITKLIVAEQDKAATSLRKNLIVTDRLVETLSQLNTYFIERGSLNVFVAKWSDSSVASRLSTLQDELNSLAPLFKTAASASITRLDLASNKPAAFASNPPPTYVEPLATPAAAPATYANAPSAAIDGASMQPIPMPASDQAAPKLTPKPNLPQAQAVAKSMIPSLQKAPAASWPVVPEDDEVEKASVSASAVAQVDEEATLKMKSMA